MTLRGEDYITIGGFKVDIIVPVAIKHLQDFLLMFRENYLLSARIKLEIEHLISPPEHFD